MGARRVLNRFMKKQSRILIVGHNDIVEHSLYDHLVESGFKNVISAGPEKWDVFNQQQVEKFFGKVKPEYVFLASTLSGGIEANQRYCAEFIYANLQSQSNIIHTAYKSKVKKLLFIASSCVYPKACPQPMKEEYFLTGALEPTSQPYAVAKIAGIEMCRAYRRQYGFNAIAMVPATLYGPQADTDSQNAHVLGALMGKFFKAQEENQKKVTLWGTGKPKREFLFSEDFADACVFLMKNYNEDQLINVGVGEDITIKDLAKMIAKQVGYQGQIEFDASKPDGAMRKLLDSSRMKNLGWQPKIGLKEGIKRTI